MLQKALWRQLWPWFWTAPKSQPWDFNLRSLSSLVKSEMSDVDEIRICQRCQNCELLRFAKRRDLPPLILSVQATLLMESSCFHAWHKREFKCLKSNAPSCRPCAKKRVHVKLIWMNSWNCDNDNACTPPKHARWNSPARSFGAWQSAAK